MVCPFNDVRKEAWMSGLTTVDINCDLGEGFGYWRIGDADDAELMDFISSANVATGFHAGDPNIMDVTVRTAAQHGICIGAHPGYRDLHGFGRRKIHGSADEIINDIVYQVGALREFCRRHGATLSHVKPHGALYMELAANEALSRAFVAAMRVIAPDTPIFCMGVSETYRQAVVVGQPTVREFYADRDYDNTGSIVFTRRTSRLNPQGVADKVVRACIDGRVQTIDGTDIDIAFESICFHSDTPGCLEIAKAIHTALMAHGIHIQKPKEKT